MAEYGLDDAGIVLDLGLSEGPWPYPDRVAGALALSGRNSPDPSAGIELKRHTVVFAAPSEADHAVILPPVGEGVVGRVEDQQAAAAANVGFKIRFHPPRQRSSRCWMLLQFRTTTS